jgi:polysaccharide biosynthesis transport protein
MQDTTLSMQNFLREFTFILFYRMKLILYTTFFIFSFALLLAIVLPPVYESSSKFFINISEEIDPLQKEQFWDLKDRMTRLMQNQKELIFSNNVVRDAVLQIQPQIKETEIGEEIEAIKASLSVAPPKGESFEGTNVFYLTYQGKNPAMVQQVTKAMTDAYIRAFDQLSKSKAEYSYEFFQKQVADLEAELKENSERLRNYEVRNASGLVDMLNLESGKTSVEVGPKALLTQALGRKQDLQQQYDSLTVIINSLEEESRNNRIPVVMSNMEGAGKTISAYRIKVAQLQLQINELRTKYTDAYEPLRALKEELNMNINLLREEFDSMLKALKIEAQGLKSEIDEVDNNIVRMESAIVNTAQERATYEKLKQDFLMAQEAYSNAVTQMDQARMATSLDRFRRSLTLVEEPGLPTTPVKPKRALLALMGLVGGFFFGIALALGRDYFDHTIKTPDDIERYLGVPCIGSISHVK